MRYIRVDVINKKFSIPFSELSLLYNLREDITFIDSFTEEQCYQTPFDYGDKFTEVCEVVPLEDKVVLLDFEPNCAYADEWDLKLLRRFHYTWFNPLRDFLRSDEFKKEAVAIAKARQTKEVFPPLEFQFSEYLRDIRTIKNVWVGEQPYLGPGVANGRAFATSSTERPDILSKIMASWNNTFNVLPDSELKTITMEGNLLINLDLASTEDGSLQGKTSTFTTKALEVLQRKEDLKVLLIGERTWDLEPMFKNELNVFKLDSSLTGISEVFKKIKR